MVSIPKIPEIPTANNVGILPWALKGLEGQADKIKNAAPNTVTTQQKLVAYLTGSVAIVVLSVVDEALHLSCFVVKAPGVLVKQLAKITSLNKYITSPALDAQDWVKHIAKARAVVFVFVAAVLYGGFNNQDQVVLAAKDVEILSSGSGKKKPAAASA
jgi:hypothetical protein